MKRARFKKILMKVTNVHGFTLVELMLTLVISTVIIGAIGVSYVAQQKSQTTQNQVTEVQQNLRAVMTLLSSEMRMAGYKPPGAAGISPGINAAVTSKGVFRFTWDKNDNGALGNAGEDIAYGFSVADDGNRDGIPDAGVASFGRQVDGGGFQPIVDNIEAVEFYYILEDTTDNGNYDPVMTLAPTAAQMDDIRAVRVTILARANRPEPDFRNTLTYTTGSGNIWPAANDNFRRRLLTTTIYLRNMGL